MLIRIFFLTSTIVIFFSVSQSYFLTEFFLPTMTILLFLY